MRSSSWSRGRRVAQACQRLACGVLAHRQVLVGHRFLLLTNSYFRVTIFIGPSLATLVTHSVTDSRLVDLIDVTLACEDANSKLVEVDVDVDDEDGVGNSLLQI